VAYLTFVNWLSDKLGVLARNEDGADAIEYLLTIAVICVAVVAGVASGLPAAWLAAIIKGVCTAINAKFPTMAITCP